MKALTIWQPWAALIASGAKPYEFRSWRPPHALIGQQIAIHAGARPMRRNEIRQLLDQLEDPDRLGQACLRADIAHPILEYAYDTLSLAAFPLAHVLCTAELGEPKRRDECAREFGENAGNDSDREGTFNWGWPLQRRRLFSPPVPAHGAQGFWNWMP